MSITRIDPGVRFCEAVVHGDTVYLAGHVAEDTSADVYGQTRDILAQLDAHLAAAGTDKSRLLMVNVWLPDIATFGDMNRAWDEWVDRTAMPARATVEARLAGPDWKVEIAAIAAR